MDKKSLKEYLDALASNKPTPGGGSAAALAGALGAGLLSMVANFTIGKEKYKDAEGQMKQCLQASEQARDRLLALVQEDARVYHQVSSAYKLPRESSEEKKKRTQAIQEALKEAAAAPLEVCRLCHETVKLCPDLLEKGNPNLVSDVGVGTVLLASAFEAALINVEINLGSIKDERFIIETSRILEPLQKEIRTIKENIWQKTREKTGSL